MMTSWAWSWDGGPAYAVHATLGSVIAHEILHAFDFHRRRLPIDPDLNIDEWLWITPNAWKRLETRIECVARLYAKSFWRKVQFYGSDVAVQVHYRFIFKICWRKMKYNVPFHYTWLCSLIGIWREMRMSPISELYKFPTRLGMLWRTERTGVFQNSRDSVQANFSL